MRSNFQTCLNKVFEREGGYVNHPEDPGGMTNLGVTRRAWSDWLGRSVTEQEMRSLTREDVTPFYKQMYWDAVRADDLPSGLDLQLFDFGINAGTHRAMRKLQEMVGSGADGIYGPNTAAAIASYIKERGIASAVVHYTDKREDHYRSLSTFSTFGRGWLNRNREVTEDAMELIYGL